MCDGLDRNIPSKTETHLSNCNAHGRRGFVDVVDDYPDECAYVLKLIQKVYACDAQAQIEKLSPEQRLALHGFPDGASRIGSVVSVLRAVAGERIPGYRSAGTWRRQHLHEAGRTIIEDLDRHRIDARP